MDLQKIKALIDLMARSRLSELDLEEGECRLRLVRGEAQGVVNTALSEVYAPHNEGLAVQASIPAHSSADTPVTPAPALASTEGYLVNAPMYGVFCMTPAPGEAPFVAIGDMVRKGQKLCMLEAMKLFHTLEADREGKIVAILAENGQEVDAGQPLFRIE